MVAALKARFPDKDFYVIMGQLVAVPTDTPVVIALFPETMVEKLERGE